MRENSGLQKPKSLGQCHQNMQRLESLNMIPSIMFHRYNDDLGTLDEGYRFKRVNEAEGDIAAFKRRTSTICQGG